MPHSTIMHTEINGYRVDKNMFTMVNLHSIHMDEDPEAFRPARLLDKDNRISKEMANRIVPFGLGRRKCVGEHLAKMENFLLFTSLMQRCSFSTADGDLISTKIKR